MKVTTVMAAIRMMTRPSSKCSSQRMGKKRARKTGLFPCCGLLVRLLRGGDQVGPDVAFELLPPRLHGLAPRRHVFLGQLLDLGLAGVGDLLLVGLVDVRGQLVGVRGGFG